MFAFLLALLMLCGAVAACASLDTEPEEPSATSEPEEDDNDEKNPPVEDKDPEEKSSVRYGLIDPQRIRFAKFEYNEKNQILSVTALDISTLAPMYYEMYKMDRVYRYDENGRLASIWLSFGYLFELSYEENGTVATGSVQHNGEDLSVRVTLGEKNVLVKEEYFDGVSTVVMEYDELGNLVKETRNETTELLCEEIEGGFRATVWMEGTERYSYDVFCNEDGTIATLTDGEMTISYAYDDDACCVSSQLQDRVSNMTYNLDCQIVLSETYHDDTQKMESFEYDENGRMIKYICHEKDVVWNEEKIFTYTYGEDGLVKSILCEYIEYDQNDVEINRTTSIIE